MIAPDRTRRPSMGNLRWDVGVVATFAVAWAGFFLHNIGDLPGQTVMSPESLLPTFVWLGALALWIVPATRTAGIWTLLAWTVLNLVGGALSVLPLPIWPYEPDQSVRHYAFHILYAASQVPLIVMACRSLRHQRPHNARGRTSKA